MADGTGPIDPNIVMMDKTVVDTMFNLVANMGTQNDRASFNTFTFRELQTEELENAFRGDWIARKVVQLPAYDMVRAGRQWHAKKNNIEALEAEEKRLNYWGKLLETLIKARLYGGAALIVGGPGSPDEPLTPERVTKGSIKWLFSVTCHELVAARLDMDLNSPYFGSPLYYELASTNGQRQQIHPSRVIRFTGADLPNMRLAVGGWGDSVLQSVADAVLHAGIAQAGIAGLIQEAKIDVVRIPRLMENLSTVEYTKRLTQRFLYAGMAKSNNNTLILDLEEEWERKQINFTQLPDILKLYLQIAAGAADIPATRLLGQAPAGLNATGESDIRQYYDRIAADQVAWLMPRIEPLDELIMRSAISRRPSDIYYEWKPLWQMDDLTKSTVAANKATTTTAYQATGLVPENVLIKAVENQLIEDGTYPGIEEAFEAAALEPDKEGNKPVGRPEPTQTGTQQTGSSGNPGSSNGG